MNNNYKNFNQEPSTPYPQAFWNNYKLFLLKHKVSKKYVNWYVYRTQHYIAAFPDHYIRDHTPQHVEHYFTQLGQDASLAAWQFRQAIDAIQILFSSALKISWAQQMDWDYWYTAAKELEVQHVTVARDYTDALADLVEPLAGEERCSAELRQR